MCGLAGLFLPRGAPAVTADMDAMLGAIAHRGPDGEGRYESPDRSYQAGFRRLAIIDLETGDQPIEGPSGDRILMGNGEIYNYRELRRRYPDYPYRSAGDMEAALAAFQERGDAFVESLNGMYALALYDRPAHRLLLVRDRMGVKPLYWARPAGGGVVFASEIKALFASGLVPAEVDEAAVTAYLAHGWVPTPDTLFRGVKKLPPGHLLRAGPDGDIAVECYWRPQPAADAPTTPEEIEEHLLGRLRDSVKMQLRSDVPIGALLSGGLDSGLMVALAAEQSSARLSTFTVTFEGAAVDEAPLAESVARRYGTDHTALTVGAASAAENLPLLAWHAEEPLFDAALLPNYLIDKVLAEHLTVALNGTGGDELFAGYGRYFRLPVEAAYLRLPATLRRGVVEPIMKRVSPMTAWQLRRADRFDGNRGLYCHEHTTHFPAPMLGMIGHAGTPPPATQATLFEAFMAGAGNDPQSGALFADMGSYLPDDLLTLLDRTTMAVSVEGRVPYLDHRVVEAALAVPPEIRTPGDRWKGLQRTLAQRFLPDAVLEAPKQGFASPVPAWIRADLGPMAKRLLKRRETLDRGWWTAAGVDRLLASPDRHGFRIYTLLMLELAVRLFCEQRAFRRPPVGGLEALADAA